MMENQSTKLTTYAYYAVEMGEKGSFIEPAERGLQLQDRPQWEYILFLLEHPITRGTDRRFN